MKNITTLILFYLFIAGVSCITGEEILSKLHQHSFKVKDFRADLDSYNKKYFNIYSVRTYKYNRTTPAVNSTINMKFSLKDKIEVVVQAYKFLSNEYRHFPIHFQANLQRAFEANAIGLKNIRNCGNMSTFIFEKDVTYHTCNFVLDETHLPPLVPSGKFKVEVKMTYLNEEFAALSFLGEVYTPIAYPKK